MPWSVKLHATHQRRCCGSRDAISTRALRRLRNEYELLLRLARDPERVFTKAELLQEVWGYRAGARTRTLDSHASRLRRKLRAAGGGEELVENVWGVGYRLLGTLGGDATGLEG